MSLTLYPLGDYIQLLQRKNLQLEFSGAPLTREVSLVSCDSRQVVPGTLFICKGAHFKVEFLQSAKEQGAFAYLSEKRYDQVDLPCILVSDVRLAMALLADFPEYCTLVFLYRQIPYKTDAKLKKLTAALAERAQVIEFAQQGQQKLQKWVRRRFAAAGKDIDAGTVDHLLFTCGSLMTGLVPEIAKIAAYARGPKITAADIDAVADPVLDARVFDMTDAVAARDYDKAAECLAELLRMQEEPIRILAALGKTLRQLYTARLAIDGGKDVLWLKDLWRMKSDYPAKKLMQSARGVRRSWCREAVKRCQTLDHRMKSERNMDSEGELKLFLMELAGVK